MARAFAMAAAGFLLGAAALFLLMHVSQDDPPAFSRDLGNVPPMSREAAESHRTSRYAGIRSIEDTLALPGDFAQTEALYTLAGRSDSARVQELIFQANRIADPSDRSAGLDILFLRLTELDPHSALALSRTAPFSAERRVEANVWHGWAKLDLDQALAAASALDSPAEKDLAAQALYAAYDYHGNETTEYIEQALGIPPNISTRAAYLFQLADRDPADAVDVINAMSDSSSRRQAAARLGQRLGRLPGGGPDQYAGLFDDTIARRAFVQSFRSAMAEADPEAVLDEMLAGKRSMHETMEAYSALQALASRDMDKAMEYLERIRNPQHRRMLASVVGQALAQADPQRALAWALENDPGMRRGLYIEMISSIAATDPELAIETANRLPAGMQRRQAFKMAVMAISQQDPARAVALLDQVEQREMRVDVARNLSMVWMQNDPDAAMTWMMTRDSTERRALLSMAASQLAQTDLETALQWLPRLDEESQRMWRMQIAPHIAMQGSVEEAQRFIRRFEGTDDYPELLASTIQGVAQVDLRAAIAMADTMMPGGSERDMLYGGLIGMFGHQDPQQAVTMLASITDEEQRAQATAMIAMQWSRYDAEAAQQWAQNLPGGAARDDAITHLASGWEEMTPSRRLMVNSIGDLEKRKQALVMHVQRLAQSDPQQAESLLNDLDLSEEERQEVLGIISMIRSRR